MPTKKPTKKTFTITEAAKELGISRQAVHRAIQRGTLKARPGKVTVPAMLIPAGSIKSYKESELHQGALKKNR